MKGFISAPCHPEFVSGSTYIRSILYKQAGSRIHVRDDGNNKINASVQHNGQKGFTLIELLVVVLIIGILAAVVLPQYQVAVRKARFSSLQPIVTALAQAQEVYYLANGRYARSFSELDITPPGGGTVVMGEDGNERIDYPGYYCRLFGTNVYCHGSQYGYYRKNLDYAAKNPGARYCVARTDNLDISFMRKMCRSLGEYESGSGGTFEFYRMK